MGNPNPEGISLSHHSARASFFNRSRSLIAAMRCAPLNGTFRPQVGHFSPGVTEIVTASRFVTIFVMVRGSVTDFVTAGVTVPVTSGDRVTLCVTVFPSL